MKVKEVDGVMVLVDSMIYELPGFIEKENLKYIGFDGFSEFRYFGGLGRLVREAVKVAKIKKARAIYIYEPFCSGLSIASTVDYYK